MSHHVPGLALYKAYDVTCSITLVVQVRLSHYIVSSDHAEEAFSVFCSFMWQRESSVARCIRDPAIWDWECLSTLPPMPCSHAL